MSEKFKELTGTPKPENELEAALKFADFDGKVQMMEGWQSVHRELHVIYAAYRKMEAENQELRAEVERLNKALVEIEDGKKSEWQMREIALAALSQSPSPREGNK